MIFAHSPSASIKARVLMIGLFFLIIFLGGILYYIKYEVMELESRLSETLAKTQETEETLRVLGAEWEYLSSATMLERHVEGENYDRIRPSQVISFDALAGYGNSRSPVQNHMFVRY